MSASAIVPLTITYTAPSATVASTVTVVGQVLDNGGTNWVPTGTSEEAIYLYTTGSGSSTVLQGTTYFISDGPGLPAQVTLSSSSGGSATATTGSSARTSISNAMGTPTASSSGSASQTATTASSSSASANAALKASGASVKQGLVAGFGLAVAAGMVWA